MFEIVPSNTKFDFLGKVRILAALSLFLVISSGAAWVLIKPNWGIDFRGGSDIILSFSKPVTADQVRTAANEVFGEANVQRFGAEDKNEFKIQTLEISVVNDQTIDKVKVKLGALAKTKRITWDSAQPDRLDVSFKEGEVDKDEIKAAIESLGLENVDVTRQGVDESTRYLVRFEDLGSKVKKGFKKALPGAFNPETGLQRLETVGPRVGEQLRNSGIFSLIVALFLILIYIAFRFDIRYAPGAVIALAHDVAISVGVFVLAGTELNLSIIAALLTIVGYSLNDTIVVFDRIRENLTDEGEDDIAAVVNRSINETLSRTIMTSVTTLLAVGAIWYFGGGLIQDFAFALIIGVLVGTYSSIFVASPVMLSFHNYIRVRRASRRATQA